MLVLRHQVNVLRRRSSKRLAFSNLDRLIFAGLYAVAPRILECFDDRRTPDGRPLASCRLSLVLALEVAVAERQTKGAARNSPTDPRDEPRQHSLGRSEDPWRTSQARHQRWPNLSRQVHGEAQETSFPRLEDVPAQSCRWHRIDRSVCRSDDRVSVALWPFLILRYDRRQILWLAVTAHPTAEWIARQLTEAIGWEHAPRYLIRDRDGAYGEVFTRRVRSMGIRDRPTAPRSPWQNGHAERLIGSIRANVLIMSWCSASDICVTCFARTCIITTAHARIYP